MVSFTTTLAQFHYEHWSYHLPVSPEITAQFTNGNNRRVKCLINNKITIHTALMPINEGSYILVNQKIRTKLNISEGDKVEVTLEKDNSEYGIPMPESFNVLLDQDEVGSKFFHSLTPGKQRSLIYIVGKVKSIDSQLNKGLAILDHLTEVQGKLDFKALNVKIKEYNQRGKMR
ncbi:YdeI/OmpD-associated family protein [Roseivirga seohaensis]|uniref:YdeI/OmpD-associated family protein n=1 Tax=Roseivirga seohaensis TaxID=1914963 RepID=UPI003BAA0949